MVSTSSTKMIINGQERSLTMRIVILFVAFSSIMSVARGQADSYLTPHNDARREVGADIPDLTWDTTLEDDSTNWALTLANSDCSLEHSDANGQYGENLYLYGGQSSTIAEDAVAYWVAEKQYYDYDSNTCVGGECRHYTQVIWKNTETVGCGSATCNDENGSTVVVCRYNPPGNYVNERPY